MMPREFDAKAQCGEAATKKAKLPQENAKNTKIKTEEKNLRESERFLGIALQRRKEDIGQAGSGHQTVAPVEKIKNDPSLCAPAPLRLCVKMELHRYG